MEAEGVAWFRSLEDAVLVGIILALGGYALTLLHGVSNNMKVVAASVAGLNQSIGQMTTSMTEIKFKVDAIEEDLQKASELLNHNETEHAAIVAKMELGISGVQKSLDQIGTELHHINARNAAFPPQQHPSRGDA